MPYPPFCNPCIARTQALCPHLHTETIGGFYAASGDVWDDIHEVCIDCGKDLSYSPSLDDLFTIQPTTH